MKLCSTQVIKGSATYKIQDANFPHTHQSSKINSF